MTFSEQQGVVPVEVQAQRMAVKFKEMTPTQTWGKEESEVLHGILGGLKQGKDFAHKLAEDMGYTDLVHDDRGGSRYFEVPQGMENPLTKLEEMSFDHGRSVSLPTPAEVAFMVPILGLKDDRDVSLVVDNMLKASNMKGLQMAWKNRAGQFMSSFDDVPGYKSRIDFVREKYGIKQ